MAYIYIRPDEFSVAEGKPKKAYPIYPSQLQLKIMDAIEKGVPRFNVQNADIRFAIQRLKKRGWIKNAGGRGKGAVWVLTGEFNPAYLRDVNPRSRKKQAL